MRVVGAGDGFARPVRVWNVPPPHEDNRLSWPDRQAIRRASDDTELEHNSCDPANFEGSEEHAITGDLDQPLPSVDECNGDVTTTIVNGRGGIQLYESRSHHK